MYRREVGMRLPKRRQNGHTRKNLTAGFWLANETKKKEEEKEEEEAEGPNKHWEWREQVAVSLLRGDENIVLSCRPDQFTLACSRITRTTSLA